MKRFLPLVVVAATGLIALAAILVVKGPPGAAQAPEAPFAYGLVRAVNAAEGEVYPDQRVAITLHAGYGDHDNNKIITSGLSNVPLGSYIYLEGKEADAHEIKIVSWKWELVGRPTYSQAALEGAESQHPRLLTDKPGQYRVKVTAKNEKGAEGSSTITATAGTYVGVERCAGCHSGSVMPDKVTAWRETGHGTKVETTYASYTPERDYCLKCHTTGYNEADRAQGFDDIAHLSGWNPAQGSLIGWLKGGNWPLDTVLISPMGRLANIQCESCHGPGSIHTGALTYDPGVCGQCHGQIQQWAESGHAKTGYNSMHQAENTSCVKCHTGEGFVEVTVRGKTPIFPYQGTSDKPATLRFNPGEQPPVACATCHDPHQATYPDVKGQKSLQLRVQGAVRTPIGVTVEAHESAVCVSCHANNRTAQRKAEYLAGKSERSTHENTQADVFYGIKESAFTFGATLQNSAHTSVVEEGCVQCHMAPNYVTDPGPDGKEGTRDDVKALSVGGHSFSVKGQWQGLTLENAENACGSCHAGLTALNRTAS